ncbi:MAG: hypothetical protein KatS3mg111_2018 [Pirellulaceae bacterium]|nr:MAG: hypothetical protein KatS3mg111_2018 [Pirellulaceae bacterium]
MPSYRFKTANLILSLSVFVFGYIFLRYAYQVADSFPFSQEIVLIVLGTLATIFITALLLQKQTEVELGKEQRIKYLDLKSTTYHQLVTDIQEFVVKGDLTREDLRHLEFLAHRVALVGSPDVLKSYGEFVAGIATAVGDAHLSQMDSDIVSRKLAELTIALRRDLIGELDDRDPEMKAVIDRYIIENTDRSIDAF